MTGKYNPLEKSITKGPEVHLAQKYEQDAKNMTKNS